VEGKTLSQADSEDASKVISMMKKDTKMRYSVSIEAFQSSEKLRALG
jgi:hypothetical protein